MQSHCIIASLPTPTSCSPTKVSFFPSTQFPNPDLPKDLFAKQ